MSKSSGSLERSSVRSGLKLLPQNLKQSLTRWSLALSILSSTVVGSAFVGIHPAMALSEEQLMQKLQQVPVFTITNAEGAPLVASVPNGQGNTGNSSVTGVFISQQDAQAFIEKLKTQNPQLANTVRVTPVPLGEVYRMAEANQSNPERVIFDLVPMQRQVDSALTLLRQEGQQVNQFPGVPLFYASGGPDQGYLTIQRGNEQVIPFFFNKEDLMSLIERYKQQQPNQQLSNVEIEVANLQQVIEVMKTSNDQQLDKIILVPARESLDYVRSLQQSGQQQPARPPQR